MLRLWRRGSTAASVLNKLKIKVEPVNTIEHKKSSYFGQVMSTSIGTLAGRIISNTFVRD